MKMINKLVYYIKDRIARYYFGKATYFNLKSRGELDKVLFFNKNNQKKN